MSHSEYAFRAPAGTPELTCEGLSAYLGASRSKRAIGTTVTVMHVAAAPGEPAYDFRLYGLVIAQIFPGRVYFPRTDDTHQATSSWLSAIVRDNGIGSGVWRIRRRAADVPGPMGGGLLAVDGDRDRPVEGYAYRVGQRGEGPWCNHDGPAAVPGTVCECGVTVPPESDYSRRRRTELAAAAS